MARNTATTTDAAPPRGVDPGTAWSVLRVGGPGAEGFLHRMLSNEVQGLGDDRATGAFLLEATGRVVSGGIVLREGDDWVILTAPGWRAALREGLGRYIIADPVELTEDDRRAVLWLDPPAPWLPTAAYGVVRGEGGLTVRIPWTGLAEAVWLPAPGGDPAAGPPAADLPTADHDRVEAERIVAGIPALGRDLDGKVIPLEANRYAWLSHTKGCYVGQEVIERMWSRDRAARRLAGFRSDAPPPAGDALPIRLTGDGAKGSLTSTAAHPELGTVALGYLTAKGEVPATLAAADGTEWRPCPLPMAAGRVVDPLPDGDQ